jgi:hypothetical protein
MAKRTPQQVLDAIDAWEDEDEIDEEMERVLAMTPEEIDRDLEAHGVNLQAEHAKADAWLERAKRGEALTPTASAPASASASASAPAPAPASAPAPATATGAAVVPLRPRRSTTMRVLTMMAATLGVLVVLVGVVPRAHDWLNRPVDVASGQKPTPAEAMREKAFLACDAQRYDECQRLLDEARTADPDGDRTPQV